MGDIYLHHRPSYRSGKFHNFIVMLDEQASTKGNNHTRLKWQEGSVVEKAAPMNCKPWMIKKVVVTDERSSVSNRVGVSQLSGSRPTL